MKYHLYRRSTDETDVPSGEDAGTFDSLDEAKESTHRRRWALHTAPNGRRVWLGHPTSQAAWYDQIRQELSR